MLQFALGGLASADVGDRCGLSMQAGSTFGHGRREVHKGISTDWSLADIFLDIEETALVI
jgi:hypothetical protein